MKSFIKKLFREAIIKKEPIGKGKDHIVYDFEKQPDKIIKIGYGSDGYKYQWDGEKKQLPLDPKHIEIFKKYPNLFPQVYKSTNMYSIIEKLDTNKIKFDEKNIFNILDKLNHEDLENMSIHYTFSSLFHELYVDSKNGDYLFSDILSYLSNLKDDEKNLVLKYINFFKRIRKTLMLEIPNLDISAGNIGYDKNGELKLLDF